MEQRTSASHDGRGIQKEEEGGKADIVTNECGRYQGTPEVNPAKRNFVQ